MKKTGIRYQPPFCSFSAGLSACLLLAVVLLPGCGRAVQTAGGMAPTITNKEPVTISGLSYVLSGPRRWDVVAIRNVPTTPTNSMFLKRVIGLPGETIVMAPAGIVVNGKLLAMPNPLSNVVYCPPEKLDKYAGVGLVKFPYTIPPQHYFVVGDNWTNSYDSRYYGAVHKSNIFGKVLSK